MIKDEAGNIISEPIGSTCDDTIKDFEKIKLQAMKKAAKQANKEQKELMEKQLKATCNQCGKQMEAIIDLEKYAVPVCTNPKCPNFALLQISIEKMGEFLKKTK